MKKFTCIICPRGCGLSIDEKTLEVTGNFCSRGEKYAISEISNPVRSLTSFVRCSDNRICSVKSSVPVPKGKIFEIIEAIKDVHPIPPIHIGDVVIKNILGLEIDMLATREIL
ncbi:MAG: DUF1667 domain-containing protein [Bacilli bacterium]